MAAIVFVVDRLSKTWIARTLELHESQAVLPGLFHLTYVRNPGAAFGLFPEHSLLLTVLSVAVVAGILLYAPRLQSASARRALGLVLGGGAGNVFDRVRAGVVVDFLDFHIWPVFNLADTAIVCGALLLAYALLVRGEAPAS